MIISTILVWFRFSLLRFADAQGLSTEDDLRGMFGDTRFVLMGGSADRAHKLAEKLQALFGLSGFALLRVAERRKAR